jgi:hypothetical protein
MRGEDIQQQDLFSYGSLEERAPADHPLRPIRAMVDAALQSLDGRFQEIYDEDGRKPSPPSPLSCQRYGQWTAAQAESKQA